MVAPVTRLQFLFGIELSSLLKLLARHRGRVSGARLRPLGQLLAFGALASGLALVESLRFGRRLKEVQLPAPPIFVIGHWRSGTTLLQRLLACDPLLHTPTFFECAAPRGFITGHPAFARRLAPFLPATRAFDDAPLGVDEPFEDEFALLKLSLSSPMLEDVFPADAARGDDGFGRDAAAGQRWCVAFEEFARRLTFAHGKRLLFKSPANTFRVALLRTVFPGAKFVHIHRHPCEVAASTIRMREALRSHNALQEAPAAPEADAVVARLARAYAAAEAARADCELGLDALQSDPRGSLAAIYRQLELPGFDAAWPRMAELAARPGTQRLRQSLAPELQEKVEKECAAAFRRYRYVSGRGSGRPAATGC